MVMPTCDLYKGKQKSLASLIEYLHWEKQRLQNSFANFAHWQVPIFWMIQLF
jgi:hypothetical protein